ncbi:MAG: class F sortase [Longispora sp.]|nr:class F sortase [Longispora sp. (in: high G+C Gram-positive bacteria)]
MRQWVGISIRSLVAAGTAIAVLMIVGAVGATLFESRLAVVLGTNEPVATAPVSREAPTPAMELPAMATDPQRPTGGLILPDGTTQPVDAVAAFPDGTLNPPEDISRLGWWVDSGLPGQGSGSVVLAGHIDSNRGKGTAHRWLELRADHLLVLVDATGGRHSYRVTETRSFDKASDFPADLINATTDPERLVLVTCGGPFIGGKTGYRDNVAITARRA